MLNSYMQLLAATALLVAVCTGSMARAEFAIHRSDGATQPNDYAGLFDVATGTQTAALAYQGSSYSNHYCLQSLDYDATTGTLFGLARDSYQARLLSWDSSGSLLSDVGLYSYPTDYYGYGMDMSVHNGIAAVHRRDAYRLTSDFARLYNSATGYPIATLANPGSAYYYALQSLDFDATTGNLFGLVRHTGAGNTARLVSWSPSGALLSDIPLNGFPTDGTSYGLDLSVHDGIVALHRRDSIALPSDYARLYDAATGNPSAALSYAGTTGNPSGYYLQSLDFDANTGNLFGLVRDSAHGSQARLLSWDLTGVLLSDIAVAGYPTIGSNGGTDLAVLSVPEPGALRAGWRRSDQLVRRRSARPPPALGSAALRSRRLMDNPDTEFFLTPIRPTSGARS